MLIAVMEIFYSTHKRQPVEFDGRRQLPVPCAYTRVKPNIYCSSYMNRVNIHDTYDAQQTCLSTADVTMLSLKYSNRPPSLHVVGIS